MVSLSDSSPSHALFEHDHTINMSDNRYNTPTEGTTDWHVPLNENFDKLNTDVEIRDADANKSNYSPTSGAKFFATDTGAIYQGDGTAWNLIGSVTRSGFAGSSHYVNYGSGLSDEEIAKFYLESSEELEVYRIAAPIKGVTEGTTDSNVRLTVYEEGPDGTKLVEVDGNDMMSTKTASSAPWVAGKSPITVNLTTGSSSVDMAPGVWVGIRRS